MKQLRFASYTVMLSSSLLALSLHSAHDPRWSKRGREDGHRAFGSDENRQLGRKDKGYESRPAQPAIIERQLGKKTSARFDQSYEMSDKKRYKKPADLPAQQGNLSPIAKPAISAFKAIGRINPQASFAALALQGNQQKEQPGEWVSPVHMPFIKQAVVRVADEDLSGLLDRLTGLKVGPSSRSASPSSCSSDSSPSRTTSCPPGF